jgi:hypothetical protein
VQCLPQRFPRLDRQGNIFQRIPQELALLCQAAQHNAFLRAEIPKERAPRDTRRRRDLVDCGLLEALVQEQPHGSARNLVVRRLARGIRSHNRAAHPGTLEPPMPVLDFPDQTILITGASSGIGVAFARSLAARAASLVQSPGAVTVSTSSLPS